MYQALSFVRGSRNSEMAKPLLKVQCKNEAVQERAASWMLKARDLFGHCARTSG